MEAAIRWSPHAYQQSPLFMIVDVAGNRLRLCEVESTHKSAIRWKQLATRDKLPNFTAFDWSKVHEHLVAIGSASGEASLLNIDAGHPKSGFTHSFNIKHQRKCNSIAFSTSNLLATGLDRVRNDFCMIVYDVNVGSLAAQQEPYKKLASSEAITSIKFFPRHPHTLVAGVSRQCIRIYDLRDSTPVSAAQYGTRQVHNLAIDPLDENYIISGGPTGDPTVIIWDRRFVSQPGPANSLGDAPTGAVLELRPAVDNTHGATVWGLRFSGSKRGCFGAISSMGELKVIEVAQPELNDHTSLLPSGDVAHSYHFVKHTHTLHYPGHHSISSHDGGSLPMAFDFMTEGPCIGAHQMISLQYNHDIKVTRIPTRAPNIHFTALDEVYCGRQVVAKPSPPIGRIAVDISTLHTHIFDRRRLQGAHKPRTISAGAQADRVGMEDFGCKTPCSIQPGTSRERHEELLNLGFPNLLLSMNDALKALGVAKRRAREGYCLDCRENKKIVANDPWLVGLWELVQRLDDLAKNDGMVAEGVDLSYLGVSSIWDNTLGEKQHSYRLVRRASTSPPLGLVSVIRKIVQDKEYPPFQGVRTERPEQRQLCLAMCGWTFSAQRIREHCRGLIEQGQCYKAIVLAVFKGHKEIALDLLKQLVHQRTLQNIGLGAVIACDTVNKDQRELCEWMAEETDDPYLKALLQHFITGEWEAVIKAEALSLVDRVGVALKYLDDDKLSHFIKLTAHGARVYGDIEGLIFTGLGESAMPLFEQYIAKFGDVQTAVLVMARTNPLYVTDSRWDYWRESYFMQMQTWRCFVERTRFIVSHNRAATTRDGVCVNKPMPRQITIRCMHCQLALARRDDQLVQFSLSQEQAAGSVPVPTSTTTATAAAVTTAGPPGKPAKPAAVHRSIRHTPSHNSGLVCPRCGRRMPRCGICMLWLGAPEPPAGVVDEYQEARHMVFCMTCTHGFHGHHAREWFSKHRTCPVPDCQCMCGLLG